MNEKNQHKFWPSERVVFIVFGADKRLFWDLFEDNLELFEFCWALYLSFKASILCLFLDENVNKYP